MMSAFDGRPLTIAVLESTALIRQSKVLRSEDWKVAEGRARPEPVVLSASKTSIRAYTAIRVQVLELRREFGMVRCLHMRVVPQHDLYCAVQ